VENDGFGLGAQRRAIDKNDLPQVQSELDTYVQALRGRQRTDDLQLTCGLIVSKEKIGANGEYNLSGERYREGTAHVDLKWPLVPIGELCVVERGASPRPIHDFITDAPDGVNWIKIGDAEVGAKYIRSTKQRVTPEGASKSRRVKRGDFILSNSMSFGRPYVMATDGCIHDGWLLLRDQSDRLDQDFLYNILGSRPVFAQFEQAATGGVVNNLNSEIVRGVKIPLPPLEMQREIVAEIENYQKVIDGARAVLDNYCPHIPIDPEWPMVELRELCEIEHGFAFKGEFFVEESGEHLPILLTPGNFVQGGGLYFTDKNTKRYSGEVPDAFHLRRGDLVVVMTDLSPMMKILGMPAIIDSDDFLHNQRIGKVVLKSKEVLKTFLRYAFLIDGVNGQIKREATGSTVRHTSPARILSVKVPLPPLAEQHAIVKGIEAEQTLVSANRELISRFERKIEETLARIWGREDSATGS
jgi:type I restriction enzyme M protein